MLNEIFSSLVAKPKSSTVLVTKPASEHNPEPVSSSPHSHNLFSKTHQNIITLFPTGYCPSVLSIKNSVYISFFPYPRYMHKELEPPPFHYCNNNRRPVHFQNNTLKNHIFLYL